MADPAVEGPRLYNLLHNCYNFNDGGSVVGISGSQGSVKTSVCLDLAEKKMDNHPEEKLFWRETLKSPMQCQRLLNHEYIIYCENNYNIKFIESSTQKKIDLTIKYFNDIDELYNMCDPGVLNVVFFKNKKSWTDIIDKCNLDSNWDTVFIDEMEGLYQAEQNNQTEERWWTWVGDSGEVIKECRKSHTSVIGNYHDENLIDHRIKGKFMFFLYGFGAIVNPSRSRVKQAMVDGCQKGEFCIAQGRNRFGKIKINTFYPAIENAIIAYA